MHNKNFKLLNKFVAKVVLFFVIFSQIVFADALPTDYSVGSVDVVVGDTLILNLKVKPRQEVPEFTVSATVLYQPSMLNYVASEFSDQNWFPITRTPNILTDTEKGMIRRSADYPTGSSPSSNFTNYKFKALKVGQTTVSIEDGILLDSLDENIGLKKKVITVNILPAGDSAKPVDKNFDVTLDILGKNAVYKQEDYTFKVYQPLKGPEITAITKVYAYNSKTELYFTDEHSYSADKNTYLTFTIPAGTLDEGDYVISADTTFSDGSKEIVSQKNLGVLSNGENWFNKYLNLWIPLSIFVICLAIIHEISTRLNLYTKLDNLKRKNKKLSLKQAGKKNQKI